MEDTGNQNVAGLLPVKDNMLALFHAPQARANFITLATEGGIIGENLATIFKLADIATGLDLAPSANRINVDVEQIGFGTKRETELAHGANAASRQFGFSRTRSKTLPSAMPLTSPSSMAIRSTAILASCCSFTTKH